MLPEDRIGRIHYFTARVDPRPDDPSLPDRQNAYLRALLTIRSLRIHYGHFLTKTVTRPLATPPAHSPQWVRVMETEEKGSDVNLATHLLYDGFRGHFAKAVIISNDSDLAEPVRLVRSELKLPVGVLNPRKRRSWQLSPKELPPGSFYKPIRTGPVAASQFPDELKDAHGTIRRPEGW